MATSKRYLGYTSIFAVGLAIAGAVGMYSYLDGLRRENYWTNQQALDKIWWRIRLFSQKATGGVPDLTWGDLWYMVRQRGGFNLEALVNGNSAYASVVNGLDTYEDLEFGRTIFKKQCVMCHGSDGTGGYGPALNQAGLKHGDSALAIYKVLRDGIPGTAMSPPALSRTQRWQLVGYIQSSLVVGERDSAAPDKELKIWVSDAQIREAGSQTDQWLTYSGSLNGQRYTPLDQINKENVSRLRVLWIHQSNAVDSVIEATPLMVDGVLFLTEPPANIIALDIRTGRVIWTYGHTLQDHLDLVYGRVNRGPAIHGHTLYFGTVDAYLVAVNANTGKLVWQTRVADASDGYAITGAPLIVNHSVVTGVAGGDYGIRGFLAAYDLDTGQQRWKFDTIPGPGQPGHETWLNDAWKTGGGATWITGSFDPDLDLLYWGVGNPAPDFNGDYRPGDNLFTNSVVALNGHTGKLVWYFQFTPHDEHDWDSAQTPILTDLSFNGVKHNVICWANRNGFYYVLNRVTGKFLTAEPFVEQNWAKGLDANGRPILADASGPTAAGRITKPAPFGGTIWQNPAFDPKRELVFVPATEGGVGSFTKGEVPPRNPGEGQWAGSGVISVRSATKVVRALQAATGRKVWERVAPAEYSGPHGGLLATGGGLVFGTQGGSIFALDSATGNELWRISLGGETRSAPISFTVDGMQVIAVSAGRSTVLFGL